MDSFPFRQKQIDMWQNSTDEYDINILIFFSIFIYKIFHFKKFSENWIWKELKVSNRTFNTRGTNIKSIQSIKLNE